MEIKFKQNWQDIEFYSLKSFHKWYSPYKKLQIYEEFLSISYDKF